MENVSVPTRLPLWNTPKEPESIFVPSGCLSFGTGAADAALQQTSASMRASRGQNNFTLILLFDLELGEPGMSRWHRPSPNIATYTRSHCKSWPDPCRRLRS